MITLAMLAAGGFLLPPKPYDHPPRIPFTVSDVSPGLFKAACRTSELGRIQLGCAYGSIIFIRADVSPQVRELVLRHEEAHVNGWGHDHPGARLLR